MCTLEVRCGHIHGLNVAPRKESSFQPLSSSLPPSDLFPVNMVPGQSVRALPRKKAVVALCVSLLFVQESRLKSVLKNITPHPVFAFLVTHALQRDEGGVCNFRRFSLD